MRYDSVSYSIAHSLIVRVLRFESTVVPCSTEGLWLSAFIHRVRRAKAVYV